MVLSTFVLISLVTFSGLVPIADPSHAIGSQATRNAELASLALPMHVLLV
jgi:hypothetical protein